MRRRFALADDVFEHDLSGTRGGDGRRIEE
jgi:hypothetical protein